MSSFSTIGSKLKVLAIPHTERASTTQPYHECAVVHIGLGALTPNARSIRDLRSTAANMELRKALSSLAKIAANPAMGYESYDANAKKPEQRSWRYEDEDTSERGWVTRQRVRRPLPSKPSKPPTNQVRES